MREVGRRNVSRKIEQNVVQKRVLFHLNEDLFALANMKVEYERILELYCSKITQKI